jgi:branched-chain amino acid transport system ATP-binding protein
MLEVAGLDAFYGKVQALHGVSLEVAAGEILCLMGRNGAGKTTTLKAIMGLVPARAGAVRLAGEDLTALPAHEIPKRGIGYVPQGRRLFAELTVAENLEIGLMSRGAGRAARERVLGLFPRLRDRLRQRAGTLSGGEQQMLAMGRALCVEPSVLLMDEPTEGLQPSMIALIRDAAVEMKTQGVAILLVEQRADAVLSIADRVTFLDAGRVRETVPAAQLREDPALIHRHVGV